jgi:cytochrome c-type biogenesis protein
MELTLGLAFIAGLVSFISPCVLPLVPAYVGYMGGRVTNTVAKGLRTGASAPAPSVGQRFGTALHGVFFVAGFTLVFVAIGLLSTAFIQEVGGSNINHVTALIGRLGGIVIVIFGLYFMGALARLFAWLRAAEDLIADPLFSLFVALIASAVVAWGITGTLALWSTPLWSSNPWLPTSAAVTLAALWLALIMGGAFMHPAQFWIGVLNRFERALYSDTRRKMNATHSTGFGGSALMGVVFAAGWTPCIGPVYGAVLTLAASGGDVGRAGTLLAAYSLGLGVPFLLTALLLDQAQGPLRRLQRRMRAIELASGTFLILIGLMIASGRLQDLSAQFAGDFAEFSIGLEEHVVEMVGAETSTPPLTGEIPPLVAGAAPELAIADSAARDVGLEVGDRAPDFQTVTDAGKPVALSDLRGQVVLLNFWATWCGPCRVEMPEFQQQYDARAADDFTILAVNSGEAPDTVRDFREELGLTFPLAMDESTAIQTQYGLFSYPTTLLLDREGVIVARHFGPLTTGQIDQMLDSVLSS